MSKEEAPASILLVDDDPEILTMLSTRLGARGYKVTTAPNGDKALEIAKRERPAVVVLDVMMPGKSGWEVARALKQDPVTAGIKIVILSAQSSLNQLTSSLFADAHIDKPQLKQLDQVIRDLVGR